MIRPKPCRPDMDGEWNAGRYRGVVPLDEMTAIPAYGVAYGEGMHAEGKRIKRCVPVATVDGSQVNPQRT